ncbi:MAG: FtsW/RodA/SpoVE family cell cycle protein [Alphaproteobacteria bacterium]
MTATFARTDTSIIGRWWWTIDRWILGALAALIGFGAILTLAATPAAATRIGLDSFHFVRLQMLYLPFALFTMFAVSLLSPRGIRRLGVLMFLVFLIATVLTLVAGPELKGARRWLEIGGMSVQPSEFLKPAFAATAAWLFSLQRLRSGFPGNIAATVLGLLAVGILMAQPDLGMAVVVSAIWFCEFFIAGLPIFWVLGFGFAGVAGLYAAYKTFPHVANRFDSFLDPASGDSYQVSTALEAFSRGGLLGRGPGEGTVKASLPDAHSDFVFAVAGEEFGLIACLVIVALYAFIVLRGFSRMYDENNMFVMLTSVGLLAGFGLQAMINMGSTLRLIPTKGMTLPFISYGGSSLLALAIGMGMVLAFTRRRAGDGGLA